MLLKNIALEKKIKNYIIILAVIFFVICQVYYLFLLREVAEQHKDFTASCLSAIKIELKDARMLHQTEAMMLMNRNFFKKEIRNARKTKNHK